MGRRRPTHDEDCECFACKLDSFHVSPAATPSRRNSLPPRATTGGGNSWERGVPTDSRGMPYLNPDSGLPVGQKAWGETYRRKFEAEKLA